MSKETETERRLTKLESILGFGKVVVTVCITATLAIVTALWNFGHWLFEHLDRLKAGINAFLSDKGGGL